MIKMNETLLNALILNPNPQPEKKEIKNFYTLLFLRMYPCKKDFVDFLTTQNVDKQYECSTRILQALCYYANFPPSLYAIYDVQYIEHDKKYSTGRAVHVSRDHFIHLVNLYLLGLYIFFYDKQFYDKIILENRFERQFSSYGNEKLNRVKDFISEWKYFCLYHDIGYGAEALSDKDSFNIFDKHKTQDALIRLEKNKIGFRKSLSKENIFDQQIFFGTIEIMTKILMSWLIIDDAKEKNNKEFKFGSFNTSELLWFGEKKNLNRNLDILSNTLKNSVKLEKIYSNHCLKYIIPSVGAENIIIVGSDTITGKIVFISFYNYSDDCRECIMLKEYKNQPNLYNIMESPDILLFDDYFTNDYDIDYLLCQDNNLKKVIDIFGNERIQIVFDLVKRKYTAQFESICNETLFMEFQFDLYMWLSEEIENRTEKSKLDNLLKNAKYDLPTNIEETIIQECLDRLDVKIDNIFLGYINEKLIRLKSKKNTTKSKGYEKKIKRQTEQYTSALKQLVSCDDFENDFYQCVEKKLFSEIEEECNLLIFYSNIYIKLLNTLDYSSIKFDYDYENASIKEKSRYLANKLSEKANVILGKKVTINYIFNSYHSPYSCVDHGICSSFYMGEILNLYKNSICKIQDEIQFICMSILLDYRGSRKDMKKVYVDNYEHIVIEVLYAIFMHNIYPKYFPLKSEMRKYKTKINSPFTYFSILCDSLQQWNRPHMISAPLLGSRPSRDASESYNIIIKDGNIYLYEGEEEDSHRKIENDIMSLREYLDNSDAFVKIGYT